jgi:hypothetical protein
MPGIDNRVEQTADAYMGNPKALQQKYAQTKDIFDLIALNTINEKVSAASREMRLRAGAEGKPPTLYERAEAQAVDNTKKEMIDEQAGVMQNKLREQQEAQKRLMQTAGAPQPQGVMNAMPQRPPSGGIAAVPAPNMQGMASMASGGIVAFSRAGSVDDRAREALDEEARQANASREAPPRETPQRETPRSESQSSMQAGLATLLGIRPAEVYRQRLEEVSGGANYSPEERAQKQRQIDEAARFAESSGLKNFLLGMAGHSTPGLAIAAGGSALQNTLNQAMINRHRAEGELIDAGPAARLAGFVRAGEGERTAMTGLAQGTGDAVKLAQIGESSASRADARATADERMRLQQAESRFDANKKMIFAQMKDLGIEPGSPESVPFFSRINEVGKTIYERMQVPQYFVPEPAPGAPVAPAPKSSFADSIKGLLGLNPATAPAARAVDFSQLQRRNQQP